MSPVNKPRAGQKPPTSTQKKPAGPNNATTGIIIGIVLVVLGALVCFVGYPMLQARKKAVPVTTIVEPDTIAVAPPDTIAVAAPEEIEVKQESSASVAAGYYIIVGSFQSKDNAERMVNDADKDIKLELLHFEELGVYRVSAGHYENIHRAYNDAYSVRDLDGCANAWVLENK